MNDEFNNFFSNKDYLESVYSMLKGKDEELKKSTLKKYIEQIEGVEYQDLQNDIEDDGALGVIGETGGNGTTGNLGFEEFCEMFQKIYENLQNPKQIFLEGFSFLDKNKKGYIDLEDLKKINGIFNHFNEDDLEGLLETAGKSDSKITFDNFLEFLNNES